MSLERTYVCLSVGSLFGYTLHMFNILLEDTIKLYRLGLSCCLVHLKVMPLPPALHLNAHIFTFPHAGFTGHRKSRAHKMQCFFSKKLRSPAVWYLITCVITVKLQSTDSIFSDLGVISNTSLCYALQLDLQEFSIHWHFLRYSFFIVYQYSIIETHAEHSWLYQQKLDFFFVFVSSFHTCPCTH